VDPEYRVMQFVEKPAEPPGTLASMGIYVFSRRTLAQMLTEDARRRDSSHDFGKDVIPRMVQGGLRVFAYPFQGYWVDVGTIEAYWQTQMDLLKHPPALDLNDRSWIVHTKSEERPPVRIQEGAVVKDSMITDGCVIEEGARVEKSVLSPGVSVGPRAVIRHSVILTDTVIEAGARIERSVIDKVVKVGRNARVGQAPRNSKSPAEGSGITTVGKNAQIPAGIRIPRGSVVAADATPEYFLRPVPAKPAPAPAPAKKV
jgi:glucose-1-phosphate adenylyltransferase